VANVSQRSFQKSLCSVPAHPAVVFADALAGAEGPLVFLGVVRDNGNGRGTLGAGRFDPVPLAGTAQSGFASRATHGGCAFPVSGNPLQGRRAADNAHGVHNASLPSNDPPNASPLSRRVGALRGTPTLPNHIYRVLGLRSQEQVFGIDALGVVAFVTHAQASGDFSVVKEVRNPVRPADLPVVVNYAVPEASVRCSEPLPAAILCDSVLGGKPLHQGFRHTLNVTHKRAERNASYKGAAI
jgi:hypothetical protein